jgi:hypothetical protein
MPVAALAFALFASAAAAPAAGPLVFEHLHDIPSTCAAETMTARGDGAGRPFLYVAAKEGGLRIYDISGAPSLVKTIPTSALGALHVMSLEQSGERLFLALGDHFVNPQAPGLAVVDVRDPEDAEVLELWSEPAARSGAGAVAVEGSRVYLAAMSHGLVVFKFTKGGELRRLSRLVPALEFPDPQPNPAMINARGLAVRDGLVYLAYDAGGVRVIDARKKKAKKPREIGRFSNPALDRKPRAYNNLALDGPRLYAAVDFCGLEILDIADPGRPALLSWWNPWHCEESPWNWFTSPGHANEIAFDPDCDLVFLATGKSDLQAVDVADPEAPLWRGGFGGTGNGIGTWGVSRQGERVYLSYICTLGIPFASNWSGVKVLRYDGCS